MNTHVKLMIHVLLTVNNSASEDDKKHLPAASRDTVLVPIISVVQFWSSR